MADRPHDQEIWNPRFTKRSKYTIVYQSCLKMIAL